MCFKFVAGKMFIVNPLSALSQPEAVLWQLPYAAFHMNVMHTKMSHQQQVHFEHDSNVVILGWTNHISYSEACRNAALQVTQSCKSHSVASTTGLHVIHCCKFLHTTAFNMRWHSEEH